MKADQERVRNLLTDTVTLLCKNGLQYQTELRVQGVLGITLDNNDVFIVHINEKFGDAIGGALTIRNDEGDAAKTLLGSTRKSHDASRGDTVNSKSGEVVHKRRRRSRESSASPALPSNSSQQQILQRPVKRLMPSNKEASESSGGVRNRSSLHNSSENEATMPSIEDIVEVKVKTEEDDVLILEENPDGRTELSATSQNIPHTTDQSAMQESYPNLSLSELQGSYQPFGEILGVTDSSTNSGADGTAPPATKRRATTGNTHESFGGSTELGPTSDAGGPFITGIMRNETMTGEVAPQTSTPTSWDPSQIPDFGTLTSRDSQMILDSAPGCSTWDTSQQSQISAAATAATHSLQNTSDQSSESVGVYFLSHVCMSPCAEISCMTEFLN